MADSLRRFTSAYILANSLIDAEYDGDYLGDENMSEEEDELEINSDQESSFSEDERDNTVRTFAELTIRNNTNQQNSTDAHQNTSQNSIDSSDNQPSTSQNPSPNSALAKPSFLGKDGFKWFDTPSHRENRSQFVFHPKLTDDLANLNTVTDFFNYIFDDILLNRILSYTNVRISNEWERITVIELRGFIGLLLLFGCTKHRVDYVDYWSVKSPHHSDWATACMTKNR